MAKARRSTAESKPLARRGPDPLAHATYWSRSMRPLHMLAFLFPLVLAYELGTFLYLTDTAAGVQRDVEAKKILGAFFDAFGLAGFFLPGVALVTVLFCWHWMTRDKWRIDGATIGGMFIEAIAWTLPLLVLAAISDHAHAAAALAAPTPTGDPVHDLPLMARLTIAIGAGLYEEMLFRLVGLALLHWIIVDLIEAPQKVGMAIAVVLSALAFALYHRPVLPQDLGKLLFYTISGIYLGSIYLMRGFGITVGTHAIYDVLVLVVFPSIRHG